MAVPILLSQYNYGTVERLIADDAVSLFQCGGFLRRQGDKPPQRSFNRGQTTPEVSFVPSYTAQRGHLKQGVLFCGKSRNLQVKICRRPLFFRLYRLTKPAVLPYEVSGTLPDDKLVTQHILLVCELFAGYDVEEFLHSSDADLPLGLAHRCERRAV